ncbi:hypothetical protein RWE15_12085 [Virgibacillus halophilus]|uniref:Uncharacterized protein n=1 Tax=Tigheibacillus halophilus TaxID=361280 RepID=A0ABU5C6R2_9BACI|nr:hypothetical protein [Virgibacillus halophilus]
MNQVVLPLGFEIKVQKNDIVITVNGFSCKHSERGGRIFFYVKRIAQPINRFRVDPEVKELFWANVLSSFVASLPNANRLMKK